MAGAYAVDEMGVLHEQRLAENHVRRDDVAGAVGDRHRVHVRRIVEAGRVHADVIDADPVLIGRVVVDRHLVVADDRHAADLLWIEPADVDEGVGPGLLQLQAHVRHVRVSSVDVMMGPRGDRRRSFTHQERDDRKVVRCEVPNDVHIPLVETEVQPRGVDVEHPSQITGVDDLLEFPHGGVVLEGVTGHEHHATLISGVDESSGVLDRGRQRLFDEGVLSGEHGAQRDLCVRARRGCHHHRLHAGENLV
ncbi:hypothetical protein BJ970_007499 [Saccharopolyspora phatthalungensis]|uniref:Uncharacterized protein n=1 Tax=Saccharopolyspora phatthalungensis TaxID=664693 RepID=A0A840QKC1_9PSEU|nr:hypothetical protein [Saccharopolyspora phatthalungensis]